MRFQVCKPSQEGQQVPKCKTGIMALYIIINSFMHAI